MGVVVGGLIVRTTNIVAMSCNVMVMKSKENTKVLAVVDPKLKKLKIKG